MYWPNGVPRVYAVNGPDIAEISADVVPERSLNTPAHEHSSVEEQPDPINDQATEGQPQESASAAAAKDATNWENEAIIGLCVSRSGHIFATITESSLSLWQTRVRYSTKLPYDTANRV